MPRHRSKSKSKPNTATGSENKQRQKEPRQSRPRPANNFSNDDSKDEGKRNLWPYWALAFLTAVVGVVMRKTVSVDPPVSTTTGGAPGPADSSSEGSQTRHQTFDEDPAKEPQSQPLFTALGTFELLETYPHDPKAFTQGLELKNSTHFYESVGNYKQSSVRIVEIATGKVVQETKLDDIFFAEGLSLCRVGGGEQKLLILLTWREKTGFRIDPESLEIINSFSYTTTNGQGWGIACDMAEAHMYVTDGTHFVHTWDGTSMNQVEKQPVTYRWPNQDGQTAATTSSLPAEKNLAQLNELEWDGASNTLLANIWYQDFIVRIQPETGFVNKMYNLQNLRPRNIRGPREDCLNGIALDKSDPSGTVVWVTGKWWPEMYKIRLID